MFVPLKSLLFILRSSARSWPFTCTPSLFKLDGGLHLLQRLVVIEPFCCYEAAPARLLLVGPECHNDSKKNKGNKSVKAASVPHLEVVDGLDGLAYSVKFLYRKGISFVQNLQCQDDAFHEFDAQQIGVDHLGEVLPYLLEGDVVEVSLELVVGVHDGLLHSFWVVFVAEEHPHRLREVHDIDFLASQGKLLTKLVQHVPAQQILGVEDSHSGHQFLHVHRWQQLHKRQVGLTTVFGDAVADGDPLPHV